uniref:Uncharacterized protein n=1 Tax=Coccidioides posadasii RMSCC 3488 TaxID=454284 RepID=A0A0J6IA10_COCPO|nr:hypothetical protein CPAG_04754 [Coccidioides posadasii RMSCC 3488]
MPFGLPHMLHAAGDSARNQLSECEVNADISGLRSDLVRALAPLRREKIAINSLHPQILVATSPLQAAISFFVGPPWDEYLIPRSRILEAASLFTKGDEAGSIDVLGGVRRKEMRFAESFGGNLREPLEPPPISPRDKRTSHPSVRGQAMWARSMAL